MDVPAPKPSATVPPWRKSTHSGGQGGDCLEVADGHPHTVPVRDSKTPHAPHLTFRAATWTSFVDALKPGSLSPR
jgi:hypothetical protein